MVHRADDPEIEEIYEYLQEHHSYPTVIASNQTDDDELIEQIITDEQFEFASFRDDSVPFGLISVRCKQLAAELSTSEE
ncbi:hypothetical protein C482_15438 [Natrialba chahannaoensis JCM 10990]|uniref:Uncharacterized protein n=1 Tax=Natrialba chahannaoensis JCM 10990 TaxID=1227492 RepID=M0ADM4_9EURY|nr:hypothetical protein [Natrialba chahannaoensis]ELY96634.1 hypothetical protein C482_15438 [Natrialba chahannaoensis JCM 10990]